MKCFHCESILKGMSDKRHGRPSKKPSHQAGLTCNTGRLTYNYVNSKFARSSERFST